MNCWQSTAPEDAVQLTRKDIEKALRLIEEDARQPDGPWVVSPSFYEWWSETYA